MRQRKSVKVSVDTARRRYLDRLYEGLAEVDADRLKRILPLFTLERGHHASLESCLQTLFPKRRESDDPLAQFRSFRDRLRTAARAANVHMRLEVETNRRLPLNRRICWFEADDDVEEGVKEFSSACADLDDRVRVESTALATTGRALEESKQPIEFVALSAAGDEGQAQELLDRLKVQFAGSRRYVFDPWDRRKILAGEQTEEKVKEAFSRALFVLAMVTPTFLGDDNCDEQSRRAIQEGKPVIPVLLGTISRDHHDLGPLHDRKPFEWKGKSYATCSPHAKNEFVLALFEAIEERLDAFSKSVRERRGRGAKAYHSCDLDQIRELAQPETACFVPTNLTMISLEAMDLDADGPGQMLAQSQPALDVLEEWALDENGPLFAAVLGEYGIGKTTTLKQLVHRLLDRREKVPTTPLPIFVDLRAYSKAIHDQKVLPLPEFLHEVFQHPWKVPHPVNLDPDAILRLVREEGALLIFDGLDEKLVHLDDREARAFVRELWSALPPHVFRPGSVRTHGRAGQRVGKLLFSCRSHYFKTIRDQGGLLRGEDRDGVRASDYRACVLLPFDETQVRHYLRQVLVDEERVEVALKLFSDVHNLRDLSRRPYLLSLIVPQIAKLEARRLAGKPVLSVNLYETLVEEWLNRDEGKHYIQKEDKRRLMEDIAAAMWRRGAREWAWEDVRQWLGDRVVKDEVMAARYLGDQRKASILDEDFRTATLVLRPDTSVDGFRFAHTSLHEYFLACALARALREGSTEVWDLPSCSPEALEFLGQLLAIEHRPERLEAARLTLRALLSEYRPRVTEVAFRYWLLAAERGLPEPVPGRLDLPGADFSDLEIRGHDKGHFLDLSGANLVGAKFRRTRWRWVDLSGADLQGSDLWRAEFSEIRAEGMNISKSNLVATNWRECSAWGLRGAGDANLHAAAFVDCEVNPDELGNDFARHGSYARCTARGEETRRTLPLSDDVPLHLMLGHRSCVTACALSPNRMLGLSGAEDHSLKLWDLVSGKCFATLCAHAAPVRACAISPDGTRAISGSDDNDLILWDIPSGQYLATFRGHSAPVLACVFSPSGAQILSGAEDGALRLWDRESGRCLATFVGSPSHVRACSFSPDGARILSGSDDSTLRMWDAASGQCLATFKGHGASVRACMFSPDGARILSGSADSTLKVWDGISGRCVTTLRGHRDFVRACAFTPDGTRGLSGSEDSTLKIWDLASGQCVATFTGHKGPVKACAISHDGTRVLSGSADCSLKLWDPGSERCIVDMEKDTAAGPTCTFSPDGTRLLSLSSDGTVRLWDIASGRCLATLKGECSPDSICAVSPDGGRLLAGSGAETLRLWDTASGECLGTFRDPDRAKDPVPDDPGFPSLLRRLNSAGLDLTNFNPSDWDFSSLASFGESSVHFGESRVTAVACTFAPDGPRVLSDLRDGNFKLWDPTSGRRIATFRDAVRGVTTWGFSLDGGRILSGSADGLTVWDASSGQRVVTLKGDGALITSCAISQDGERVLAGFADGARRVWSLAGQSLAGLKRDTDSALACAFSPDGPRDVLRRPDGTLQVRDLASGQELLSIADGPDGEVAALSFRRNQILAASPKAWRFVAWRYINSAQQSHCMLPADHFSALRITGG